MQKQKGISTLFGIAIIISFAAVSFGGAFAYQYFIKSKFPIRQLSDNDQSNTNVRNLNSEIKDWETFKNNEYGFEFRYPVDFYTSSLDAKPFELDQIKFHYKLPNLNSIKMLHLDNKEYKNSGFQFAYFNVAIDQNQGDVSVCKNLASGSESSRMSQKIQVDINGQTFYRYKIYDDAMGGQRGTGYVYFGVVNSKCFVMHGFHAYRDIRGFVDYQITFDDSEIVKISNKFEDIASTFKFTTPIAVNSSSITITSPNGGEIFNLGQEIPIRWESTGIDSVYIYAYYYDANGQVGIPDGINYSFNEGECRLTYEAVSAKNGTFIANKGDRCGLMPEGIRIKITIRDSKNGNTEDVSDNYFSIKK